MKSYNISKDGNKILINDFGNNQKIINVIEEISHSYKIDSKYPQLELTKSELFVIVERDQDNFINYYTKEDSNKNDSIYKENNLITKQYKLEIISRIDDLDRNDKVLSFLRNYANFKDDKDLKAIIKKKKIQ